jgi:hypothetical protein
MGLRLTGSALQLADECGYPFTPDAVIMTDVFGLAARKGTAFHDLACGEVNHTPETVAAVAERLGVEREGVERRFRGWRGQWPLVAPPNAHAEVALAFDPATGVPRVLGIDIGRAYAQHGCLKTDVAMSIDVVGYDGLTDTAYAIDHKTGWHVDPAVEHAQIRACAVLWARFLGASRAVGELHKVEEDGSIRIDRVEFDAPAIEAGIEWLKGLSRWVGSVPEPSPGPHCTARFCKALLSCPAHRDALKSIEVGALGPVESPEQLERSLGFVSTARLLAKRLERAAKCVEDQQHALCEKNAGSVELARGRKFVRRVRSGRSYVDSKAVRRDFGNRYLVTGKTQISYEVEDS